ncbi:MAG: hypothetical protein SGI74_13565 [Oligoflexia bacterium]|nr:hypothetical protein [Oligoflexia bacterium]
MKKMSLVVAILVLMTTSKALATNSKIAELGEKSFEAEIENLDIHDLEGQREQSLNEARHQTIRAKELAKELSNTRNRKKVVEKRTRISMNDSEFRRSKAEKEQRRDKKETAFLERQIQKLEKDSEKAEIQARKAQERAEKAKIAHEQSKVKKTQTALRKQTAIDQRVQKENETKLILAERKKTLIEAAQLERESLTLEKKLAVATHIAERGVNALDIAKEKRAQTLAKRDQGRMALATAQADIKALENEYRKTISETKKFEEIARLNTIEMEKRRAFVSHKRQELALAKSRNKTARNSIDRRPATSQQ